MFNGPGLPARSLAGSTDRPNGNSPSNDHTQLGQTKAKLTNQQNVKNAREQTCYLSLAVNGAA